MTEATHNTLGALIFHDLIEGTEDESEALTLLESLNLAVLMLYRPDPADARKVFDQMATNVIERMKGIGPV